MIIEAHFVAAVVPTSPRIVLISPAKHVSGWQQAQRWWEAERGE